MSKLSGWFAAVLLVAVFFAADAGSQPSSGIARFRQTQVSHTNQGDFPGATEVWQERVRLLHRAVVAGTGSIACIHVTAKTSQCFGSYILPLGRIKVLGEFFGRSSYTLAIVGGIGAYTGATGVVTFVPGLVTFFIV